VPIFIEMGKYSASLRAIGDVRTLPATIELSNGNLSIAAGDTEIGTWPLDEIRLEKIPTGYRMSAEGDQVLLEMNDLDSFAEELAKAGSRSKGLSFRRKNKKERKQKDATRSQAEATEPRRVESSTVRAQSTTPSQPPIREPAGTSAKKEDRPGVGTRVLETVDSILLKAQKRFGAYLPDFVFSRAMFFIGVAVLVAGVFMPGLFSNLLIAVGALLIAFGAVVYSDSVLASRWLPGRATPQHALLAGVAVLLIGVIFGVIIK
jgi:hypothetical protein